MPQPLKASRLLGVPRGLKLKISCVVLTLRLCVLYGSHSRQRLLPHTVLADKFCITEVESVYCAVRTESFCKTDMFSLSRFK